MTTKQWVILIALAASLFRLTFMDLSEFKTDQAHLVYKMAEFYSSPEFYFYGSKNSAGVHNFPLIYYVFILLTLPSRDPLVLTFVIALINVVAIVFFYLIAKKFYGNFVGLVAALLLSFSPWHILYSRQIWTPDLILPLSIPLFYFVHKLLLEGNPKSIWGVAFFSLLIFQWHATGIVLFATIAAIILLLRTKINFKFLILGVVLGLLPTLPFWIYQFSQTNLCPDCSTYLNFTQEVRPFSEAFFVDLFLLFNALDIPQFLGNDWNQFSKYPFIQIINFIQILLLPIFLIGIIYVLKSKKYLFLSLFLILTPLIYFLMRANTYSYYLLIIAPVAAIVYALGIHFLYKQGKYKILSLTLIGLLLATNIIFEASLLYFINQKQDIDGPYGSIYRLTEEKLKDNWMSHQGSAEFDLVKARVLFNHFNDLNPKFKQLYED